MDDLKETPSQTAGPFVHIGLVPWAAGFEVYDQELGHDIAGPHAAGERIRVEGVVIDGDGEPVTDIVLEVWQADAAGRYASLGVEVEDGFCGWGRVVPDFETGVWAVETVKPGAVHGPDGALQAPHITLWLVARGINIGLHTRMYFEDEAEANAQDAVLSALADRAQTLMARKVGDAAYRFDIRLQGEGETVFFDV